MTHRMESQPRGKMRRANAPEAIRAAARVLWGFHVGKQFQSHKAHRDGKITTNLGLKAKQQPNNSYLDVPCGKLGSMDYFTFFNGGLTGVLFHPLILTFYDNCPWDILVPVIGGARV